MQRNILAMSELERELYLRTIINVALSDGFISEEEKEFIFLQSKILNINVETLLKNPDSNLDFLKKHKLSKITAMTIIRDCIFLGHLDKNYSDSEKERVRSITKYLGLHDDEVVMVEKWMEDYLAILQRGAQLFGT